MPGDSRKTPSCPNHSNEGVSPNRIVASAKRSCHPFHYSSSVSCQFSTQLGAHSAVGDSRFEPALVRLIRASSSHSLFEMSSALPSEIIFSNKATADYDKVGNADLLLTVFRFQTFVVLYIVEGLFILIVNLFLTIRLFTNRNLRAQKEFVVSVLWPVVTIQLPGS